jgi:cell division protein FtsN
MLTLIILGLLTCGTLFLLAALIFLYRFISRKRLFPQLPRLWARERTRFFIFSGLFIVSLAAFALVGILPPESLLPSPGPKAPSLGPSFDGKPPPPAAPAAKIARTQEPQTEAQSQTALNATEAGGSAPQAKAPEIKAKPEATQTQLDQGASNLAQPEPPETATSEMPEKAQATAKAENLAPNTEGQKAKAEQATISGKGWTVQKPQAQPNQQSQAPPPPKTEPAQAATPPKPEPASKPLAQQAKPKAKIQTKAYSVCAASYRKKEAAQKDAAQFTAQGLKATVMTVDLKGKGRWNRVCVGSFPDRGTAQAKAAAWKKQGLIPDPFIVRIR